MYPDKVWSRSIWIREGLLYIELKKPLQCETLLGLARELIKAPKSVETRNSVIA